MGKAVRMHVYQHKDKLHDDMERLGAWIQRKANRIEDPQHMVRLEEFGKRKVKDMQDKINELDKHLLKDNKQILEPYGVQIPAYEPQAQQLLKDIHRHMNRHFGRTL